MPRVQITLPAELGEAKSKFVSAQSVLNMFFERDRHSHSGLYGRPAWGSAFVTFADGPVRGLHKFGAVILAVSGQRLYTVTSAGVATDVGAILGVDPVSMADNGLQAVIVSDSVSYVWDGATLVQITDPDFQIASSVDFFDQYMIFSKKATGQYFISALADATSYDAIDIKTAEARPDKLIRVFTSGREVLLMGEETGEGVYDSGALAFPFERSTTYFDYGLYGRDAIGRVDNSFAWLANDKSVRILRGGTAQRISDHDIETIIAAWPDPALTRCFTYSVRGHEFFVLRNPAGCIVWDAVGGTWHRCKSKDADTWKVATAVIAWGGSYVGTAIDGVIYRLDESYYDEAGETILREMVTHTIGPGGTPFTLDGLELEVAVGVGAVTGQGSDPMIWAQLSRDGGYTWGARMQRRLGARGNRDVRVIWDDGYGQFKPHGGVIKFGISDPVETTIVRAFATYTTDRP